jgi:hypothetical protein
LDGDTDLGDLASRTTAVCEALVTLTAATFDKAVVSTATATGLNGGNFEQLTASDDATVIVIAQPLNPSIERNEEQHDEGAGSQQVRVDDDAIVTVTLANPDIAVPLTDVVMADPSAPGCDKNFTRTFAVGDTETYTCTTVAATHGFDSMANATGNDPHGDPVTNDDPPDSSFSPRSRLPIDDQPSSMLSDTPSDSPSDQPSSSPSDQPSSSPSDQPSSSPSDQPSDVPSTSQSSALPGGQPSDSPSSMSSVEQRLLPNSPSNVDRTQRLPPSASPDVKPSTLPTSEPIVILNDQARDSPSSSPFVERSLLPSSSSIVESSVWTKSDSY